MAQGSIKTFPHHPSHQKPNAHRNANVVDMNRKMELMELDDSENSCSSNQAEIPVMDGVRCVSFVSCYFVVEKLMKEYDVAQLLERNSDLWHEQLYQ